MRLLSSVTFILAVILIVGSTEGPNRDVDKNKNITILLNIVQKMNDTWTKLNAGFYKHRHDICVWKVCSRPLQKMKPVKSLDKTELKIRIKIEKNSDGVYSYKILNKNISVEKEWSKFFEKPSSSVILLPF